MYAVPKLRQRFTQSQIRIIAGVFVGSSRARKSPPPKKSICTRLLELSQVESGERCDLDRSTLAPWERGERDPKLLSVYMPSGFLTDVEGAFGC